MLQRVAVDRTPGRLDPLLVSTDRMLRTWAPLARPYYASRFPGQLSGDGRQIPKVERAAWPASVLQVDEAVRSLCPRLASAVMAHYMTQQGSAARATAYAALVRHFEAARPPGKKPYSGNPSAFRADLDRSRWVLRFLLHTSAEELEAAFNKAAVLAPRYLQR